MTLQIHSSAEISMTRKACHLVHAASMLAGLALMHSAPTALASDVDSSRASREESVGVASGLAVGAAAAGPFGAVIGAATGAWLGDRWGAERRAQRVSQRASDRSLAQLDGLSSTFQFRTAEAALTPADAEALRRLGEWLAVSPKIRVHIAGHADSRGNAEYNLELSQRRALSVAAALEAAGLDPARMQVEALGASGPALDPDGNSLRRRVTLVLEREALSMARTR